VRRPGVPGSAADRPACTDFSMTGFYQKDDFNYFDE
jgi:hypothetical protein